MGFKKRPLSWLAVVLIAIGLMPVKAGAESALPYLELTRPDRGKVFAVAWSLDGQYIAVGTEQGLWLYTDTFADVLHVADQPIHALAWSPDGQVIATGYFGQWVEPQSSPKDTSDRPPIYSMQGGGLRLWSVKTTEQGLSVTALMALLKDGSVYALRFNPDGSRLASLSQDAIVSNSDDGMEQDSLRLYAVGSGKLLQEFSDSTYLMQEDAITQSASGLAWSHDGRYLAAIRSFGKNAGEHFSVWDTALEQFALKPGVLDDCGAGLGSNTGVDWSTDDTYLALSGMYMFPTSEGGIRVGYWGNQQAECLKPPLLSQSPDGVSGADIFALAWRPNSQQLVYADQTAIQLWDTATKQPVAVLDAAREAVTMLAWNADGSKLLAAGSDYAVRIWTRFDSYQSPDPRPVREVTLATKPLDSVLSPDGQWVAALNETSGLVEVSNVVSGKVQRSIDARAGQPTTQVVRRHIQWSPDGTMLAIPIISGNGSAGCSSLPEETVQLWSVQTGTLIRSWNGITSLAWRPDSRAVAVGMVVPSSKWLDASIDGFQVRDIQTGQVIEKAPPDEQWADILSRSRSGIVYFDHLFSVAGWSPDGQLLAINDGVACGVYDNPSVILWDMQSHKIAAQLDAPRRTIYGGSGGSGAIAGWSPDGNTVVVRGFGQEFLYRLHRQGDQITPELIWRRPNDGPLYYLADLSDNIPFSPYGRYFLFGGTVWDTVSGWPVFRFRAPMLYRTYRWIGDTLTGYDLGFLGDNSPGKAVSWRVGDFLPQTSQ